MSKKEDEKSDPIILDIRAPGQAEELLKWLQSEHEKEKEKEKEKK